ncbi:PAXIP1-associated glutamate-rich protein 1A [Chionoecetes opilio]|uniref:PAXIP1-associated glutamate-rich protein 1A n=1 Tax=Chionoecetes opilio TaxID=41210 RepID=A0A8J4Y831_CHIOP|nr:PAXIP1-associated glutamate-rich protein 1A [Chionoecetes opilio]
MGHDKYVVECSDEEVEKQFTKGGYGYEPSPGEVVRLYEAVAVEGALRLAWRWERGRRAPTPSQSDSMSEKEEEEEKVDTSGFDFDEDTPSVRPAPRRTPGNSGLKGSAKKKTTSFENVLANVRRHKKLEFREKTRSRKESRK